ncbi:MAG: HAD-IC family P-type ATPase [Oscillospiraceae bacterium]
MAHGPFSAARACAACCGAESKVELLDALSISISACRRDFGTAGMVMFLLEVGELLEEWTRKKSVADLARCMSLNVDRVWLRTAQGEVLIPVSQIQPGDAVVVRAGGIVPVDGLVLEGEVTVNQASLTGESIPVPKRPGGAVYAGTVVEEGECVLEVKQASGQSRYDQIVHMIEQSEQMKSEAESKAANLADKLVPYTFAGSLISFALTRNVARALSVLMVDFSCALKLAMPLAVLSAMREAGRAHITVKGGKFLEAVAAADTIVFDKTGTLTHACPKVAQVIPSAAQERRKCCGWPPAWRSISPLHGQRRGGGGKAPGPASRGVPLQGAISGGPRHLQHCRTGSGCSSAAPTSSLRTKAARIPEGEQERFDALPAEYSHLYLWHGRAAGRCHLHLRSSA